MKRYGFKTQEYYAFRKKYFTDILKDAFKGRSKKRKSIKVKGMVLQFTNLEVITLLE